MCHRKGFSLRKLELGKKLESSSSQVQQFFAWALKCQHRFARFAISHSPDSPNSEIPLLHKFRVRKNFFLQLFSGLFFSNYRARAFAVIAIPQIDFITPGLPVRKVLKKWRELLIRIPSPSMYTWVSFSLRPINACKNVSGLFSQLYPRRKKTWKDPRKRFIYHDTVWKLSLSPFFKWTKKEKKRKEE